MHLFIQLSDNFIPVKPLFYVCIVGYYFICPWYEIQVRRLTQIFRQLAGSWGSDCSYRRMCSSHPLRITYHSNLPNPDLLQAWSLFQDKMSFPWASWKVERSVLQLPREQAAVVPVWLTNFGVYKIERQESLSFSAELYIIPNIVIFAREVDHAKLQQPPAEIVPLCLWELWLQAFLQ